jgi:hypothetical protein
MRDLIISIRVSGVEKRRLMIAARRAGCPISDLVRWALRRELAGPYDKGVGRSIRG